MFVHKAWLLQCLMAMCVLTCVLSPVTSLFPYGTSAGDAANPQTTLASSGPLTVSPTLVFYNNSYNHLHVNNDGFISFTGNGSVYNLKADFPSSYPAICIFGCDINPRADGRVWYRVSSAASDIQGVQNITGRYYLGDSGTFVPTWVLVASWVQVHSPADSSTQGNTMQLTVASNGVTSVVMMEFSLISWVKDIIGSSTIRAQVGFNKGNSLQSYVFPESKSEALFNLPNLTNVDQPGFFLFRVDEDIVVPSLITTTAASTASATTSPVTSTSTETTLAVPSTSTSTETPAVTSTSTVTTPAVTSTSTVTTTAVTSTSTVTTTAVTSTSSATTTAVTSTSSATTTAATSTSTSTETPAVTSTSTVTTTAVTSTSSATTTAVTSTSSATTTAATSTSTSTETPAVTSTSTETPAVTSTSTVTTPAVSSTSSATTTAATSTSTSTETPAVTSTSTSTSTETPAVTSTSTPTTPAMTLTSTEATITYSERTETSTAAAAKSTTSTATDAPTSEKATVTSTTTPSTTSSPGTSAAITTSVQTGEPARSNQTDELRAEDYYIGFGVGGGVALILLAVGAYFVARYFFRRSNRVNSGKHDESSRGLQEYKSSRTHVTGTWQSDDNPYRIPRPRFSPRARR